MKYLGNIITKGYIYFLFKYILLKIWLYEKKHGTPFEMFQFGLFWMVLISILIITVGKLL